MMEFNDLMTICIIGLLHPLHQGYFRSGGSYGARVFEEMVITNKIGLCVRDEEEGDYRMRLSMGGYQDNNNNNNSQVSRPHHPNHFPMQITALQTQPCFDYQYMMPTAPYNGEHLVLSYGPFDSRGLKFNMLDGCAEVKHLDIICDPSVTNVEDVGAALRCSTTIEELTLHGFENVVRVKDCFITSFNSIKTLDLTLLRHVTCVGACFMRNCSTLTTVDLTPLRHVTSIGGSFMTQCTSITHIHGLDKLTNVQSIAEFFLSNCSKLVEVDLTPFTWVTTIESGLLSECEALQTVDLTPLQRATTVGDLALIGCRGITNIDLTPLANVTVFGHHFMCLCDNLTGIDISPLLPTAIRGEGFLTMCGRAVDAQLNYHT